MPENNRHIFLSGFMGSGKSTLGKKLAILMQRDFVDLDKYIEKKELQSTSELFEKRGETYFRQKEAGYLYETIEQQVPCVISLGGGTVCFHNNISVIKKNGFLIYLELPAKVLYQRILQSPQQRPLLKGLQGEALLLHISEMLEARKKYYTQAHITLNALNLTPQELKSCITEFEKANIA